MALCSKALQMKYNHQFCSICEIVEKIDFLVHPPKAYIFYANRLLYFLQKKSRNNLCVRPHDTYVLFRTFFSQINNKSFFTAGVSTISRQMLCLLKKSSCPKCNEHNRRILLKLYLQRKLIWHSGDYTYSGQHQCNVNIRIGVAYELRSH